MEQASPVDLTPQTLKRRSWRSEGGQIAQELNSIREGKCWDDDKGGWLDPVLIRKAREEDMQHVKEHAVYEKVTIGASAGRRPWRSHTNKGTSECLNTGSQWVLKQHLFSATSPLDGVKLAISEAASGNQKGTGLLVIDERRAHFYAKARRSVHIELPEGDGGGPGSRQCGLLRKSLYGTRDAAKSWECELGGFLEEIGLRRGQVRTSLSRPPGETLSGRSKSSKRGTSLRRR